ncbi:single-stranded DNA-binding protein [Gryllotalpicola reticulitermitis]|uniref:Single-stranded DNA-binding protein n=1 Tax=Gryllotalpicola reticulitermitis TaxID=1184153 RepID=A0ABV8Q5A6_9MICO
MNASVTVKGFIATQPKFVIVGDNLAISSFRLGVSNRRFNAEINQWETTNTSWYSVSCFRDLASNAYASLNKGDPVIVQGMLKVSEWSAGDKSGLDVEITAEAIGHDLRWGKATGFARTPSKRSGQGPERDGEFEERAEPAAVATGLSPVAAGLWNNPVDSFESAHVIDSGEPTEDSPDLGAGPELVVDDEAQKTPF